MNETFFYKKMKLITPIIVVLMSWYIMITPLSAMGLTPREFLENYFELNNVQHQYYENVLGLASGVVLGSSLFIQDVQSKEVAVRGGLVLLGERLVSRYMGRHQGDYETKYHEHYFEESGRDPVELIQEMKQDIKDSRYIVGGLLLVPMFFDLSGASTVNKTDTNTIYKALLLGGSLSLFIFETPFETIADSVIKNHQKKQQNKAQAKKTMSVFILPSSDQVALLAKLSF